MQKKISWDLPPFHCICIVCVTVIMHTFKQSKSKVIMGCWNELSSIVSICLYIWPLIHVSDLIIVPHVAKCQHCVKNATQVVKESQLLTQQLSRLLGQTMKLTFIIFSPFTFCTHFGIWLKMDESSEIFQRQTEKKAKGERWIWMDGYC
jgi:uncharacterized membrane protein HdeD (DUF308 family)